MSLDSMLENLCDRFYVVPEKLELYGKNCAADTVLDKRKCSAAKALSLAKKAMAVVRSLPKTESGFFRLMSGELFRIEEAFSSLDGLTGLCFPSCGGYPAVLYLGLGFVRAGEECANTACLERFISGAEKHRRLTFSEADNFYLFARLGLLLCLGELCRRYLELESRFPFSGNEAAFHSDRRLVRDKQNELSRGLEEQARVYLHMLSRFESKALCRGALYCCENEKILNRDPAGAYPVSSEETKAYIRYLVSEAAKLEVTSEEAVLSDILQSSARDRGVTELAVSLRAVETRRKTGRMIWLALENALPVFGAVICGLAGNALCGVLTYPVWREIITVLMNFLSPRFVRPRVLCALELKNGVPEESATLCVISLLSDSPKTVTTHLEKLLSYRLANPDCKENVKFGLLMDLPDSVEQTAGTDEDILSCARLGIERLNESFGNCFFAAYRDRVWSEGEGAFIPSERKRGAIMALAGLACGRKTEIRLFGSEPGSLRAKYILTLDADTEPMPGNIKPLIGAISHPVNRAVISPEGRLVSGYGIVKPAVSVDLLSASRTMLSRIYAGKGGTDRYSSPLTDVEWCLFGSSDFTGKGIIDANALISVLETKLPNGRILSHDILEGGCVGCGYAHSVTFADGFPSTVSGYFKRLGRWTRGDTQLLPWIFDSRVQLSPVTRYRIAKNFLRAFAPVSALGCIVLSVWGYSDFGAGAVVALVWLGLQFIINIVLRARRPWQFFQRRHSQVYSGWRGGVMLGFSRFVFLPREAWTCLRSVFLSVWRMTVTKKKMLEWVTAAEGDRRSPGGLFKNWFSMLSCVVTGAVTVLVGMDVPCFALAVIWFLAPLYASYLSQPITDERIIRESDRRLLSDHAEKMGSYFINLSECGYQLPPDNFQEQPFIGWADRTSPTNLGFYLLSWCALACLSRVSWEEAAKKCSELTGKAERLEKYRGNLYNWYGCSDPVPLEPRYISSVDSGNFAACAATAARCFEKQGDGHSVLVARLDALWRNTDLSVFYDKEKKLMAIGLDSDKKRLGGFYDMLSSEARLTSYVAIAKGDVPAEHWSALSRHMTSFRGYCGLTAWSGSLFEYLMPDIFLPAYRGTLLWESGEFAIHTQRKTAEKRNAPWGVSECCYLTFDSAMNYQYKAHGDPVLARGNIDGDEYAVSPYSVCLALSRGVRRGVKGLESLEELGLLGRFGMCDAVEFTPSRLPSDTEYMPVRTYMTHHLGMSLCSVANALCENALSRAFMSVSEFGAIKQLLCEQIPEDNPKRGKHSTRIYRRHRSLSPVYADRVFTEWDICRPPVGVLSNLELTSVQFSTGAGQCNAGEDIIYRREPGFVSAVRYGGKAFWIKGPSEESGVKRTFGVYGDRVEYLFETRGLQVRETVYVTRGAPYETHSFELFCDSPGEAEIGVYFEPQLCSVEKYSAHPEFERLKLELTLRESGDGADIIRHDSADGDRFYSLIWDKAPDRICVSRRAVLGRGGISDPKGIIEFPAATSSRGDPCFCGVFRGEKSFSLSVGRLSKENVPKRRARGFVTAAKAFGLDGRLWSEALDTVAAVLSGKGGGRGYLPLGKEYLWELRISGDDPIVLVSAEDHLSESAFLTAVFSALKVHRLCRRFGIRYDLALVSSDGGSYDRPGFNGVGTAVRLAGCEEALNQNGGVHVIDRGSVSEKTVKALEMYSMRIGQGNAGLFREKYLPALTLRDGSLASRVHSEPLANPCFGCVMADIGPVLIYSRNSRMLKLIPWQNDPYANAGRGFELCTVQNGRRYSLFASNDGMGSSVRFLPGAVVWERKIQGKTFKTTAWVAPGSPVLVFAVETEDAVGETVLWRMEPCLCEKEADREHVFTDYADGVFTGRNPADPTGTTVFAQWSEKPEKAGLDKTAWLSGFEREDSVRNREFCGRLRIPPCGSLVLTVSTDEAHGVYEGAFYREGLEKALAARRYDSLRISTGDSVLDEYINVWSEYQIRVSRLWAKSSVFQNGGAVGFRDQLQDSAALLLTSPEILREQLLRCCAHQYEEGDVMHWFHEGAPDFCRGVRTRCSDDLLWLVRETAEYVLSTGDRELLDVRVKYLSSPPLGEEEGDRYEAVAYSSVEESVFSHCIRAMNMFFSRGFDGRGLPYILGGDWNDGFSRLGEKGRGVSVWLAFFAAGTMELFGDMCKKYSLSSPWDLEAKAAQTAWAAFNAWDGDRFVRAWTDSGVPVGSKGSPFMGIDSIAQSFSWFVRADGEQEEKRKIALDTAVRLLREKNGVWKLFDRPVTDPALGYIGDYPPGVRENGGQYTHGAMWLATALFRAGRPDEGYGVLRDVLDLGHSESYGGEPFVIAADVSDKGQCGWSWYTGSAGWFRRTVVEEMLGIRLVSGELRVSPRLPSRMDGYCCELKVNGTLCRINVKRTGARRDGSAVLSGGEIELNVTV